MSRSVKKTPIFGHTTAASEKQDKQRWNRAFRRVCKILVQKQEETPIKISAITEIWSGNKDGKTYWRGANKKNMRK